MGIRPVTLAKEVELSDVVAAMVRGAPAEVVVMSGGSVTGCGGLVRVSSVIGVRALGFWFSVPDPSIPCCVVGGYSLPFLTSISSSVKWRH